MADFSAWPFAPIEASQYETIQDLVSLVECDDPLADAAREWVDRLEHMSLYDWRQWTGRSH